MQHHSQEHRHNVELHINDGKLLRAEMLFINDEFVDGRMRTIVRLQIEPGSDAEALALAILQGDDTAALAAADEVQMTTAQPEGFVSRADLVAMLRRWRAWSDMTTPQSKPSLSVLLSISAETEILLERLEP